MKLICFGCSFKVGVKLILINEKMKTLYSTDNSGLNAKKHFSSNEKCFCDTGGRGRTDTPEGTRF